ncbi:hypothetical protein JTB14_006547 [Gonioctena quinquepunctata]|nr:hypothetical protein JTB14_006547 [Gonioctena quinquepunctata]
MRLEEIPEFATDHSGRELPRSDLRNSNMRDRFLDHQIHHSAVRQNSSIDSSSSLYRNRTHLIREDGDSDHANYYVTPEDLNACSRSQNAQSNSQANWRTRDDNSNTNYRHQETSQNSRPSGQNTYNNDRHNGETGNRQTRVVEDSRNPRANENRQAPTNPYRNFPPNRSGNFSGRNQVPPRVNPPAGKLDARRPYTDNGPPLRKFSREETFSQIENTNLSVHPPRRGETSRETSNPVESLISLGDDTLLGRALPRNSVRSQEIGRNDQRKPDSELLASLSENVTYGEHLPRIMVKFDGQLTSALLDTGATANFIRADLVKHLEVNDEYNPIMVQMGCQNDSCPSKGRVQAPIGIGEMEYVMGFTVLEELNEKEMYLLWECATANRILGCCEQFDSTKDDVMKVVENFPDVFSETIRQPVTEASLHEIKITAEKPFRHFRYGKLSEERKKLVHEEIDKLLEAGVVVPSTSEYCSPVVLVPKKDGKLRFCVDYRKINKIIVPEAPNLPSREMGQARVFTTLDSRNGFWQAPLTKNLWKYTAFGAPDGTVYEFRVLAFGLRKDLPHSRS